MPPPLGSLQKRLGRPLTRMLEPATRHLTGLLSIAEDQPRAEATVRAYATEGEIVESLAAVFGRYVERAVA